MSKDKKIAVDHANDRQPNNSHSQKNESEPNLDQQETNVKRLLGDDYEQFIASKFSWSKNVGIDASHESLPSGLFPFQRDVVRWALARGRAALFEDCGMGKSFQQLAWASIVASASSGRVLIVAPLAVALQTVREGERFGIACEYAKSPDDATDGASIIVTNYERLEKFLPWTGVGVVLDESSILKAYDGKTRSLIISAFKDTPFRLACTATPAPNDYMELGNHAEFLGVMRREEMLATYFTHDGGDTAKWRLKGHAERLFWQWVCSWAVMLRKPSDLGHDDGAFTLPPLEFHQHVVTVDHRTAYQSGTLFKLEANTLKERRDARRASINERVTLAAEIVAKEPNESFLIWCNLNSEGDALEDAIPGAVQVSGADDVDIKTKCAIDFAEGRIRVLISKPSIFGFGLNFQSCARVLFVGLSDSYEDLYQAVRRCWRFGQKRPVDCHLIISELEGAVLSNIRRKESDAERMAVEMVANMASLQTVTSQTRSRYLPSTSLATPSWMGSAS